MNTLQSNVVNAKQECPTPRLADVAGFAEPVFQSFGSINLCENADSLSPGTSEYLAHAVAREPDRLITHVQRIALHVRRNEAGPICGALLDLFIVLGTRGLPLRKRMLGLAKSHLEPRVLQFLTANLKRGVSANDVLPESTDSVLTAAISGTTELVKQVENLATEERDPLQESRECLEFGQVEEAQRILEAAILEAPERIELHRDLLEIYAHTGDRERFHKMRGLLESKKSLFGQLWEETAASFKNAVNQ